METCLRWYGADQGSDKNRLCAYKKLAFHLWRVNPKRNKAMQTTHFASDNIIISKNKLNVNYSFLILISDFNFVFIKKSPSLILGENDRVTANWIASWAAVFGNTFQQHIFGAPGDTFLSASRLAHKEMWLLDCSLLSSLPPSPSVKMCPKTLFLQLAIQLTYRDWAVSLAVL